MTAYISCERCDFRPGDYINQQYLVEKTLGEGTFGKVYRIKDSLGKIYAIKLLKLWTVESRDREKLMKRFDMEYEAGQIQSNYLVHSFNKGIAKGNPYILMEYCPGGDLLQAAESRKMDFAIVASEVLYGLRDLHKCGKVHRDLKPENVLFRQNGSAVLTDFGISGDQNKRMTECNFLGTPQQIFGTYGYMPPEQVNPKRGDATVLPTTDIFSFGVMMYQMLTYEMPFGPLNSEGDLPNYLGNGKKGNWDKDLLKRMPNGEKWVPVIDGCLVPDFKRRLQTVDNVLSLLPCAGKSQSSYRPSSIPQPDMQIKNGVLLRVMQGEEYGKVYKLDKLLAPNCNLITVGRYDENIYNHIAIKEEESCYISRIHCTLELDYERGKWIIRDGQWRSECPIALRSKELFPCKLCTASCNKDFYENSRSFWKNSLNGTYINSTDVTTNGVTISPGDIISIGDVKLRVEGY